MSRRTKIILVVIAVIVAAGGFWYFRRDSSEKERQTTTPQRRDITESLEVTGVISALEMANLTFTAPGRLSWVGVEEGDEVKQWQAIASLDTRTLQKQLQQDFNTFEKTWRTHDQTLDDTDYYSPTLTDEFKRIVEKSSFDLQNSAIQVEIRNLAIRLSSIVSPIDGTVTQIDEPHAGANISATDVFQIINFDTLFFQAYVDEEDVPKITNLQTTMIELDAFPQRQFEANISAIAKVPTTTETGTGYEVEIPLVVEPDLKELLRIGMNGTAEVIIERKEQVLTVESETLISREGQLYVEVLSGDTIEHVPIEVGLETDEYVEIHSGLRETDQVMLPRQDTDE